MRNNVHGYLMVVILVSFQIWIKEYEKLCAIFFLYIRRALLNLFLMTGNSFKNVYKFHKDQFN